MAGNHIALVYVIWAAWPAFGQECPKTQTGGPTIPSAVRTLDGNLVFHDGIRQWFELKLDQPQCGENSIQLVETAGKASPLDVLRGCRIRSQGAIDFSGTGYFSANLYQEVKTVEPIGPCVRQTPFPDYSKAKPDGTIHGYRVEMHVDYRSGDHAIVFTVSSGGKELRPWQAYASYSLTGGFVLYGHCGEGFVVDQVFGTPEATPSHFDEPQTPEDMAMFDPESAANAGKKDLLLGYTCVRKP